MKFNVENNVKEICQWLKEQLTISGSKGYVIGISGGKDSGVVAGLACRAVGKEKVFGVLMPNGEQSDIKDSIKLCEDLGIEYTTVNIHNAYSGIKNELGEVSNRETLINIAPRLRMTTLYAFAQEKNFLVCGTGNKSEGYIGYCTKWGDTGFDVNPIGDFTTAEVVAIGDYLNITPEVIHKAPSDGLSGMSDEEKIGFTYEELNSFIETGSCENPETEQKIKTMHKNSRHKFSLPPKFNKV